MPRPKEFDPEQVLDKALHLFWRKGYEATSVQDLVDTMGINRFSLYDTFGDKHQLYLAALRRYDQQMVGEKLQAFEHSEEGLPAIRRYFDEWIDWAQTRGGCPGCLMTNSAVELALHDTAATAIVRKHLERTEEAFHKALVCARKKGEISKSINLRDTARYLTGNAMGFSVLAKGRPDPKVLKSAIRVIFSHLKKS